MTKKVQTPKRERRITSQEISLRASSSDAKSGKKIVGYALLWAPVTTQDMGSWVEQVDRHAFDECLASSPDVRALINHDSNLVLGRTPSTLRLFTDSKGLRYEIDPAIEQSYTKDLMISMERGDVTQSSYGFICTEDRWEDRGDFLLRTVLKAELFDVSPVTYPATVETTSGLRGDVACTLSYPPDLRSKYKLADSIVRADGVDDDDDSDDDLDCDGEDSEDPRCEDRCDCRCERCLVGEHEKCSDPSCDSPACTACAMQSNRAYVHLLKVRSR